MSEKATFVQMCLRGRAAPSDIDDWIDRWHEATEPDTLAEFLGFTSVEYARWVAHPEALGEILAEHRELVVAASGSSTK